MYISFRSQSAGLGDSWTTQQVTAPFEDDDGNVAFPLDQKSAWLRGFKQSWSHAEFQRLTVVESCTQMEPGLVRNFPQWWAAAWFQSVLKYFNHAVVAIRAATTSRGHLSVRNRLRDAEPGSDGCGHFERVGADWCPWRLLGVVTPSKAGKRLSQKRTEQKRNNTWWWPNDVMVVALALTAPLMVVTKCHYALD